MLAYFLKILNKKLSIRKVLVDRQRPYPRFQPKKVQSSHSFTG